MLSSPDPYGSRSAFLKLLWMTLLYLRDLLIVLNGSENYCSLGTCRNQWNSCQKSLLLSSTCLPPPSPSTTSVLCPVCWSPPYPALASQWITVTVSFCKQHPWRATVIAWVLHRSQEHLWFIELLLSWRRRRRNVQTRLLWQVDLCWVFFAIPICLNYFWSMHCEGFQFC